MSLIMKTYKIIAITKEHIEGFHKALDSVAKERKYIAILEGPPIELSRARVIRNLENNFPHYIAISDEKVVGWCDLSSPNRPIYAHTGLLGMGVIADYRRQGIGEKLVLTTLEQAKEIGLTRIELTVREPNKAAFALYKKLGFVEEGVHRNAARVDSNYEDVISMALLFD
jgi:ribosomal protein S18 acetylase RimI-like enzyme